MTHSPILPRPKALLFDIGNVLVTFDFARTARRLAEGSRLGAEEAYVRIRPLVIELECGRLGTEEFVERAMESAEYHGTREEFVEAYQRIFELNEPMVALVERLAGEFPLYHLSNTSQLHLDHLVEAFPVFAHFQGGAYSHVSGCMKPEEKIYRDAISAAGVEPGEIVYLDDLEPNIVAGRQLGLHTVHYDWQRHEDALHQMSWK